MRASADSLIYDLRISGSMRKIFPSWQINSKRSGNAGQLNVAIMSWYDLRSLFVELFGTAQSVIIELTL